MIFFRMHLLKGKLFLLFFPQGIETQQDQDSGQSDVQRDGLTQVAEDAKERHHQTYGRSVLWTSWHRRAVSTFENDVN